LSFLGLLLFGGVFVVDLSATCCYSTHLFVSAWQLVSRLVGHRSVVVAQPGRPTSIAVALLLTVIKQVATIVLGVMADSILNIEIQAEDILSSVVVTVRPNKTRVARHAVLLLAVANIDKRSR
jgi:hypothetical protein